MFCPEFFTAFLCGLCGLLLLRYTGVKDKTLRSSNDKYITWGQSKSYRLVYSVMF